MKEILRSCITELIDGGMSYREIALKTGVSHSTIESIHKGLTKNPRLKTIQQLVSGLDINEHEIAHKIFELPPPVEGGEFDGILDEICTAVVGMNDEQLTIMLTFSKFLLGGGDVEEIASAAAQKAKSGQRGRPAKKG